jgi:hypothetical protein
VVRACIMTVQGNGTETGVEVWVAKERLNGALVVLVLLEVLVRFEEPPP